MVGNIALMKQINTIAQGEKDKNVPILQAGAEFWTAVADSLEKNHQALGDAANKVAERWRDSTHPVAFGDPVNAGLDSIKKSVQTIVQAKPQEAARTAIGQIEAIAQKIAQKLAQYIEVHNLAENLAKQPDANQMGPTAQMLAQLQKRMEELEQEAAKLLERMGTQGYAPAKPSVKAAGEGHAWKGPQSASAASAASAASTASADGSGVASSSASVSTGGTGEAGESSTVQAPDMGQTGTDTTASEGDAPAENASETGLAGGATTAPAAPAGPPAPTPAAGPTAAGVGAPMAGAGRIPIIPMAAGLGARGASTGQIPQAAKVPGGIVSTSSGKAPSIPTESSGAAGALSARKPGMAPMGMGAGVPGMLAPMASSSLQGLINRLKPIVTRPGALRVEPESVAGVPKGLRGRTARTNDDDAFRMAPRPTARNRRSTTTDAPPETVQLLDEEIWQVEQSKPNIETASAHR